MLSINISAYPVFSRNLSDFKYTDSFQRNKNIVLNKFQFNGYTDHWHDIYQEWIRYGNLFTFVIPNVEYTIAQSKVDIAEDLGIPGLSMQEVFLNGLLTESYFSC